MCIYYLFILYKINTFIFDNAKFDQFYQIKWRVRNNINNNFALRAHIVQIYSKDLLYKLKEIDAKTFEQQIQNLKTNHANDLTIWELDLIDQTDMPPTTIINQRGFYGIIVFVHHYNEGKINKIICPLDSDAILVELCDNNVAVYSKQQYQHECVYLKEEK